VLVAYGVYGKRDVYEKDFDNPLASFNERQEGCDCASDLVAHGCPPSDADHE
jgi:hypothetical protein